MKELFCFPCNLPFKNRGEHLKFIGKDQWKDVLEVDASPDNPVELPVKETKNEEN